MTRWGLVFLLWGAGLGAAAQYGKISVLFDLLPEMFPGTSANPGFAVSLVGLVGIAFGAIAGPIVSRLGYRRALGLSLALGAAMSAVQALGPSWTPFLVSRGIEGIAHLGIVVATPTLIAQISADKDRGFTLTLWGTFFGVAFALLAWFGRPLADAVGPQALFWVHAVIMAVFAVILTLWLGPEDDPPADPPRPIGLWASHAAIYRSARIAAPGLGWLFYTMCFLSILTLIPPYLPDATRAALVGAMPLTSIAVSLTLGVWLLGRITAVQVVIVGFVGAVLVLVWLAVQPGAPVAALVLAGALGLVQGASFAAVPQLNATAADRAAANGAMAQMGNLGNTIGTPLMVVALGTAGYGGMIWLCAGLMSLGAVVHLALSRTRARSR